MMARSFKSVAWVGAIGAAALVCYIFSMHVAEERAGLAELDAQISRTEQSIQTLKTELGTRGRVHQLQHWAAADFGFASPTAGQFVADEVTLANLDMPAEAATMEAPVRMAEAPAAAPTLPRAIQASAPAPAPERPAVRQASAGQAAGRPLLRRAALNTDEAAAERPRPAAARPRAARSAGTLVDSRTLQDIDARARNERGGNRTETRPR